MAWVAPRTYVAAAVLTAAQLNETRDSLKAIGDAWTSYTPTWSSTGTAPVLGNGTLTGAWVSAGKLTTFSIKLVMGSTTTYGSGNWTLTLPATPVNKGRQSANAVYWDNSATAIYGGWLYWSSTSSGSLNYPGTSGLFTQTGAGNPFVFATSDEIVVTGVYEAA